MTQIELIGTSQKRQIAVSWTNEHESLNRNISPPPSGKPKRKTAYRKANTSVFELHFEKSHNATASRGDKVSCH